MVTIPYTFGPADDWDPQGYEEEEEDTIAPGMHVLKDDGKDDDLEDDTDAGLITKPVEEEEDEEEIDEESSFKDLEKDALEQLNELEDLVLQSERETLKLTDYNEEE
jgi:hypothetical protein